MTMMTRLLLVTLVGGLALAAGCGKDEPSSDAGPTTKIVAFEPEEIAGLDLLFVIDNSSSLDLEQEALRQAFPRLVEALRLPALGDRPPPMHIGVVSSDVGAGDYGLPSCEVAGGDGGRLQNTPRLAGCTPPAEAWVSYVAGTTNVPGCTGDGVACIGDAFSCIAHLGSFGCGFEAPLESARLALDPTRNINPGFLRDRAHLAVIFMTDEDDCSASNPALFDPQQQGLSDPLGPLTSFRCFEFGIQCDVNDRDAVGPRKGCVPAYDWLYKVEDYVTFFASLKSSRDRVMMLAIAGPIAPVVVGKDGPNPVLKPSCQSQDGFAPPALRINAVISAFGGEIAPLCDGDDGPAFERFGKKIASSLSEPGCFSAPLALLGPHGKVGGIACAKGKNSCKMPSCDAATGESCDATTGLCLKSGKPTGRYCGASCLDKVECQAVDIENSGKIDRKEVPIAQCPATLFQQPALANQCGASCPCWRIVPRDACAARPNGAPFAFEVMRKTPAAATTQTLASCRVYEAPWDGAFVQQAPLHCVAR